MATKHRRGHGEGTIRRRQDGRWEAAITLEGRRRKSLYGKTRLEAQQKMVAALKARQDGLPIGTNDRQTVAQFLTRWLEETAKPRVRPKTYVSYEGHIRLHLVPVIGRVPLTKLSPDHVQRLYNDKLEAGLSARTIHHFRETLRSALSDALRWGHVSRNVAALVDPPRAKRHEIRPLSPEEARTFLEASRTHRLHALYSVVLAVGLRQGEALGLGWDDVDLKRGEIRVARALQRVGGKLTYVEPKSETSRRVVAIPVPIVAELQAHQDAQGFERRGAGEKWTETGLVFTTKIGTPLDGGNVTKQFQAILEGAGLPRQRFHDLRHSCASLLLAQGVHPRVVMETLGHSQISLTMNTYSHVMPELQREAADKMGELLFALG